MGHSLSALGYFLAYNTALSVEIRRIIEGIEVMYLGYRRCIDSLCFYPFLKYTHTCVFISFQSYAVGHIYIYIYIYTYTHTHTHTHIYISNCGILHYDCSCFGLSSVLHIDIYVRVFT